MDSQGLSADLTNESTFKCTCNLTWISHVGLRKCLTSKKSGFFLLPSIKKEAHQFITFHVKIKYLSKFGTWRLCFFSCPPWLHQNFKTAIDADASLFTIAKHIIPLLVYYIWNYFHLLSDAGFQGHHPLFISAVRHKCLSFTITFITRTQD